MESRSGHECTWQRVNFYIRGICIVTEPRPNTSGLTNCLNICSYQYRPNIYILRENPLQRELSTVHVLLSKTEIENIKHRLK